MKRITKKLAGLLLGAAYLLSPLQAQTSTGPTKAEVNALDARLDTAEGTISGHTTSIGLKASKDGSDLTNPTTWKTGLSLNNVNNTSDASKPISSATQTALDAKVRVRKYYQGSPAALTAVRETIEAGRSVAIAGIGDSTFRDSSGPLYQLATLWAARYPTHRVELYRAADNMQSITRTVVSAGPSGERYLEFSASADNGHYIPTALTRTSLNAASGFRIEVGFSLPSGRLNGSGWPTNNPAFMTGCDSVGNKTVFYLNTNGTLALQVQGPGGTSVSATSTSAIAAMSGGTRVDFRVDYTATDGSVARMSFYRSTDAGVNWSAVGSTNVSGGTAVVPAMTGSYWIAAPSGAPLQPQMQFYRVQWLTTAGIPMFPDRIDMWRAAAGQFTPTATLGGSPTIYIDQAAQDGATMKANGFFTGSGAGDLSTEAYRCLIDHVPELAIINSSHNDFAFDFASREAAYDACVTVLNNWYLVDPAIVLSGQNPEKLTAPNDAQDEHRRWQKRIFVYGAKHNYGVFDVNKANVDANDSGNDQDNNVHPSTQGYQLWGRVIDDGFQSGTNNVVSGLPN